MNVVESEGICYVLDVAGTNTAGSLEMPLRGRIQLELQLSKMAGLQSKPSIGDRVCAVYATFRYS